MKSLAIILTGLWASSQSIDLYSDDALYNMIAPAGLVICVIALTFWLVLHADLVLYRHHSDGYQSDKTDFSRDSLSSHRGD